MTFSHDLEVAIQVSGTRTASGVGLAGTVHADKAFGAVVVTTAVAFKKVLAIAKKLVKGLVRVARRRRLVDLAGVVSAQAALFTLAAIHVWRQESHRRAQNWVSVPTKRRF